jgi:bifunctional DNA-binding transcriptional regulator/antitoxin component of YhaV-PrlF toxin-antitoxin module
MGEEQSQIGVVTARLSWSKSHANNVQPQISLDDLPVKKSTQYEFTVESLTDKVSTTFMMETQLSKKQVTIPARIVREIDLRPGKRIKLRVSEPNQEWGGIAEINADESVLLGSAKAIKDTSNSDGVDSRLSGTHLKKYVGQFDHFGLQNESNRKRTVIKPQTVNAGISFPIEAREELGVNGGDNISVYGLNIKNSPAKDASANGGWQAREINGLSDKELLVETRNRIDEILERIDD